MPSFRLAHAWPGRHWPHTASGEAAFIEALGRSAQGRSKKFDRNDVTWLLTALRAGSDPDDILRMAEGINPQRLLCAYHHLDTALELAIEAWQTMCANPTAKVIASNADAAQPVLPVPVSRLRISVTDGPVVELCAQLSSMVVRTRLLVDTASSSLEQLTGSAEGAQLAGRRLWNASSGCLWNDPYFLPLRVGELAPVRVGDLLGTRRQSDLT